MLMALRSKEVRRDGRARLRSSDMQDQESAACDSARPRSMNAAKIIWAASSALDHRQGARGAAEPVSPSAIRCCRPARARSASSYGASNMTRRPSPRTRSPRSRLLREEDYKSRIRAKINKLAEKVARSRLARWPPVPSEAEKPARRQAREVCRRSRVPEVRGHAR